MPLPITADQKRLLYSIQRKSPALAYLTTAIATAFDPFATENPELARAILMVTTQRIASRDPAAPVALIEHLENFRKLGCLSDQQVARFVNQIQKLDC